MAGQATSKGEGDDIPSGAMFKREALNMSQAKKVAGNEKIKQSRLASLRLSRSAAGDDRKAGHRRGELSRAVIEQK